MTISDSLRSRIREQAKNRCGYCLIEDGLVYAPMEIDHIQPKAAGGKDAEENLWLLCPCCNAFKGYRTKGIDPVTGLNFPLFNPRQQNGQNTSHGQRIKQLLLASPHADVQVFIPSNSTLRLTWN